MLPPRSPIAARDLLRKYGYLNSHDSGAGGKHKFEFSVVINGLHYSVADYINPDDQDSIDRFHIQAAAVLVKELDRLGIKRDS